MKKFFVDSNYFIALNNTTDHLHQPAKEIAQKIADSQLLISDYVFSEIMTVMTQRVSKNRALDLGEQLLTSPYIQLIQTGRKQFERTWEIFAQLESKNISFVDCSIVASLETHQIDNLISFDQTDFSSLAQQFGFNLINS
jgi:predicted nucleic acid-binding protein